MSAIDRFCSNDGVLIASIRLQCILYAIASELLFSVPTKAMRYVRAWLTWEPIIWKWWKEAPSTIDTLRFSLNRWLHFTLLPRGMISCVSSLCAKIHSGFCLIKFLQQFSDKHFDSSTIFFFPSSSPPYTYQERRCHRKSLQQYDHLSRIAFHNVPGRVISQF